VPANVFRTAGGAAQPDVTRSSVNSQFSPHVEPQGKDADGKVLVVGDRAEARYKGKGTKYYTGKISAVVPHRDGTFTFNLAYDDGDKEEGALPVNVRRIGPSTSARVRDEESRPADVATRQLLLSHRSPILPPLTQRAAL